MNKCPRCAAGFMRRKYSERHYTEYQCSSCCWIVTTLKRTRKGRKP